MERRILGRTGLTVSRVALGAGPVPALMTGGDTDQQREVLARALAVGINWIDTAAGYGGGQSEASLGKALASLGARERFHVATKVRIGPDDLEDIEGAVRRSLTGSLSRLGIERVTLLQLHNGITRQRGDMAASLSPEDVLGRGGVREALERMRSEGRAQFVGLTGTGTTEALAEVIGSGGFDTIQIPHHLVGPADATLLLRCRGEGMGILAIRVFAGGALLGQPPSAHTLKTPYFPLPVYQEEQRRAACLEQALGAEMPVKELALRFALVDPVDVALVGLATPEQVEEVAELAERGPLSQEWLERIEAWRG